MFLASKWILSTLLIYAFHTFRFYSKSLFCSCRWCLWKLLTKAQCVWKRFPSLESFLIKVDFIIQPLWLTHYKDTFFAITVWFLGAHTNAVILSLYVLNSFYLLCFRLVALIEVFHCFSFQWVNAWKQRCQLQGLWKSCLNLYLCLPCCCERIVRFQNKRKESVILYFLCTYFTARIKWAANASAR